MNHLKLFEAYNAESLNENIFAVNIDELYNAVEKFTKTLEYNKGDTRLEKKEDRVQFIIERKLTSYDLSRYYNMDNDKITAELKKRCNMINSDFSQFKKFTEKGLRGFSEMFRKQLRYVMVGSVCQIRILKSIKIDEYRNYKTTVWLISENGDTDTGMNEKEYIERSGDDSINKETMIVDVSLHESSRDQYTE